MPREARRDNASPEKTANPFYETLTMIELRPLTQANWVACAKLPLLANQQGLVSPNVYSIAQLNFEPHYIPRVIYAGDQMIGFLVYCPETDPPDPTLFWLFRFMVAAGHQGKGYGGSALRLALLEMKAAGAARVRTMHKPGNDAAAKLYRRHGFAEIGPSDDGDVELEMQFDPTANSPLTPNTSQTGRAS